MVRKGHKRKNNHVVIVTSDATDSKVRQFRVRPWILQTVILVQCVIIGALIGFFLYERDVWAGELQQTESENEAIAALEQEKAELEGQIADLNGEIDDLNVKIGILSETVTQKTQTETQLSEQLEKQTMPTEFPLTGKASMEETAEENGNPICIFTASEGSMVVAAASGSVIVVNEDPEYGNNVWVDHGNGYTTIYRSAGEVKVKQGETVTQGATLFVITGEGGKLGYQVTRDGAYISPMEILEISG
ncbi:murein hydrolase activator EnvC family protein [Acetatifactor aquisgranensis]|uniref:murein hydrolase activator EnvC family protein n=1 Tax=Acetatifactor aquisgranensis TaxID=2941233 RepID=UPI002041BD9E|nr:peptidoglycan DD-metalloendopeptidase family protein [Acetatifactor aquisgranensis]MCI8542556.1 peptidoglycan DD-metalloendopeptidase family protein [Lachnospiraceae bacterium]